MLSKLGCLLLVLSFGNSFCSSQDDLPEIDTPLGRVRGYWKTLDGITYAAFEGIPYAKPPVGDLRFEESEPIPAWSGTWVANVSYTCLQGQVLSTLEKEPGDEDCLYINVYIPEDSVKNPKALDVIVSIHGGGFMSGSGTEFDTFLDKEAVLVSFNYRLGILGFLSTEDHVIPGNNGMKDQVLALEWVRDNIASFGGNPHSVTIVGLSAGGASVHLHYFSPLSKGLFIKGISQSGTALGPWVTKKNALQNAKKLAVLLGCPDSPSEELKKCLKQKPAKNLVEQIKYFYGYDITPIAPFAPVVEKGSKNAFLDAKPYQLLKEGKVHDVPWITSYTTGEGLLLTGVLWQKLDEVDEKWVEILPYLLDCNETLPVSERETVAKELLDYYLGPGEKISKNNYVEFTQILTDRLFGVPAELSVKLQANVTKSPVYLYIFNYTDGATKLVQIISGTDEIEGVCHGEDFMYFYTNQQTLSGQDKRLGIACQNMLYSFASSCNPSFDGTDVWQPTGAEDLTYLVVNGPEDMKLHKSEHLAPVEFWTKLGFLDYENLIVKN
ncbi:venom carboxylesterase-6-like isoform X3 [Anoplophora glabripennis]|uniref:venom carboxylesterase-6-like isoform X3 n=1 Tax=Anoplophora glabripennis TaxID=217634 RepID=UPI000C773FA5|nr:venom carboxylesterase-6-like isoform X3 [Anoplophora glabripennis]